MSTALPGPESSTGSGATESNINPASTTDKWLPQMQEISSGIVSSTVDETTSGTETVPHGKIHRFGSLYMQSTKFLSTLPNRIRACYEELKTVGEQNPTLSLRPDCPCSWPMEHEMDNHAGCSTPETLSLSPTTDLLRLLTDIGPGGDTEAAYALSSLALVDIQTETAVHRSGKEPPVVIRDTVTVQAPKTPQGDLFSSGGSKCSVDEIPGPISYSGSERGEIGPTHRTVTNSTIQKPQKSSVSVDQTQYKPSQMQSDLQLRGLSAHQNSAVYGLPTTPHSLQDLQLEADQGRSNGLSALGQQNNASASGLGITDRMPPIERLSSGIYRLPQKTNVLIDSLTSNAAVSEERAGNLGVAGQKMVDQCSIRPIEKVQTIASTPQAALHIQGSSAAPTIPERTERHGYTSKAPQSSMSEISLGSVPEAPLPERTVSLPPLLSLPQSSTPKVQEVLTTSDPGPIDISVVEPMHTRRVAYPHSQLAKMGIVKAGGSTSDMPICSDDHRLQSDDTTQGLQSPEMLTKAGSQAVHVGDSYGKGSNTNIRKSDRKTRSHVESAPKPPVSTYVSPDQIPDPLKDFEKLAGMSQKWADLEAELLSKGKPLTQEQLKWAKVFQKLQEVKSSIKTDEDIQTITDSELQETNLERDKRTAKRKSQKKKAKKKQKQVGASGEHDIDKERIDTADETTAPPWAALSDNWPPNSSASQFLPATLPAPGGFLFPAPFAGQPLDEGLRLPREESSPKLTDLYSQNSPPKLVSFPPLPEDFVPAKEENLDSEEVLGLTPCFKVTKSEPSSKAQSQASTMRMNCIEAPSAECDTTYRINIPREEIIPTQSIAATQDTSNSRTDAIFQSKFIPSRQPRVTRTYLIERLTQEISKAEVEKLYKSKIKQLVMDNRIPNSTTLKQLIVSFTRRYITDCLQHILDEYDGHRALTYAIKKELAGIVRVASVLREKEAERFVGVFLNTHIWVDVNENNISSAAGDFSEEPKEESPWDLGKGAPNSQEMKRVVPQGNIDYRAPSIEGVQMTAQRGPKNSNILQSKLETMGNAAEETEHGHGYSNARIVVLHQQDLAPLVVHTQCTARLEELSPSLQSRLTGKTERAIEGCTVEKMPQITEVLREYDYPKPGDIKWLEDSCAEDFTQLGRQLEYQKRPNLRIRDHERKKVEHTDAEKGIFRAPFFTTQSRDEWQYNRMYSNEYFRVLNSHHQGHSRDKLPDGNRVQLGKRRRETKEGGCGVAECTGCRACPGSSNRRPCPRGQVIFSFSAGEAVLLEAAIDKEKEADIVTITPIEERKFRSLRKAGVVVKDWDPLAACPDEKCVGMDNSARQDEIATMKETLFIEQKVAESKERPATENRHLMGAEMEQKILQAAKQFIETAGTYATGKSKIECKKK